MLKVFLDPVKEKMMERIRNMEMEGDSDSVFNHPSQIYLFGVVELSKMLIKWKIMPHVYVYGLLVGLTVCLYQINVKTAEPIRTNFFV